MAVVDTTSEVSAMVTDDAAGPISPFPWTAVETGSNGYIRILDRDGKDVGIDAFPSRPRCDAGRIRASVAVMLEIVNAFHERNSNDDRP